LGTAFGIAIDHFVLEHRLPAIPSMQPAAAPSNQHPVGPRRRPDQQRKSSSSLSQERHLRRLFRQTFSPRSSHPLCRPDPRPLCRRRSRRYEHGRFPFPAIVLLPRPSHFWLPAASFRLLQGAACQFARLDQRGSLASTTASGATLAPAPAVTAPPPALPEKPVVDQGNLTEERLLATAVRALRAQRDAASALLALMPIEAGIRKAECLSRRLSCASTR